nr:MMPL family transporter [Paraburkholderia sp. HP33-1]
MLLCVLITGVLGWRASHLTVNASFERMIPQSHEFIRNYNTYKSDLGGMGNALRIVVENRNGDIYDPAYLDVVRQITDKVTVMPGVDRAWVRSLWMPGVRWNAITEDGMAGGAVMPSQFDGSPQKMEQFRLNVSRAGLTGDLISLDNRSSMIYVPLLDTIPETGKPLDYPALAKRLDNEIRVLERTPDSKGRPLKVTVRIVGFAQLVGDMIKGLGQVATFFLAAAFVAAAVVYVYTRCLRSTALLLFTALLSVVWLLGLMQLLGYEIDPYSILVPFLVFAIGLSHGAQKMNGIMQDIGRGVHKYVAARYTFRRLFLAGLTALLANVFGFAVLLVIDIPVIRDMAITTSIGVSVLIFTALVLVPVLLSYLGVGRKAAARATAAHGRSNRESNGALVRFLVKCTTPRRAWILIIIALGLGMDAVGVRSRLQVGDLDPGAPELRADSRYNRDVAFLASNFGRSTDQFVVFVKSPPGECGKFESLVQMERLGAQLEEVPGVQATQSLADKVRYYTLVPGEGNPKWMSLSRDPRITETGASEMAANNPDIADFRCEMASVVAYLSDHRAPTLTRVVQKVKEFAAQNNTAQRQFLLAGGSAGIEAATNQVVEKASVTVLLLLYSSVIVLCAIAFRSWRAVLVALIPLVITSLLCEALMVLLGIGVKVATLPVIALGVGAGVDYALYLLSVQLTLQRRGASLTDAYRGALMFTGKVVALVGFTLAAGVVTWVFSPLKFQADMGILLTFMFLWNMVGALVLIPALSHVLLRGESRKARAGNAAPDAPLGLT